MSREPTAFLYPFIEGDERDAARLLDDLAASAGAKATESARLRASTLADVADRLDRAADAMAERFAAGGRLFTFGNGGSATDAAGIAALFAHPSVGRPLPARSLAADEAVVTALGNDIGFDAVFSRQLIAHAHGGDVALGISTSGDSRNVILAFGEAKRRGMLTVGLAGYGGGQMAACPDVDHCVAVRSDSVHRIQEVQSACSFELWKRVQDRLAGGGIA